jgi:N-formylglutamate amidohydrolase
MPRATSIPWSPACWGCALAIALLTHRLPTALAQDQLPPANQSFEIDQFVATQVGELPIILSAPHGGNLDLPGVPARKGEGLETGAAGFFIGRDSGTEELTQAVAEAIERQFGKRPYMVISRTHRRYLDPNRPADIAFEDAKVKPIYDLYHARLTEYCNQITERFHAGVLLDIHGQGSKRDTVFRGTKHGLTVENLRERFGELAHSGPQSLFGALQTRGWTVHPADFTGGDLNGKEQTGFTGGYIVQTYGSHKTLTVDAMQLEFGAEYRVAKRRVQTAAVLADALAEYATTYLKLNVPFDAERVRPPKAESRSIRVAVFVDEGVSSTVKLFDVLSSDPSLSAIKVSAEDVRAGKLEQYSLLIHPGGSGSKQGRALGEQGREKVREFVRAGGGFVGICAGAYLAAGERNWSLGVLDAKVVDRAHWNRGFGNVTMAMSPQGLETLGVTRTKPEIYYHQGPLLEPGNDPNVPDFQSLATFETEIAKNGAAAGIMQGTTAIAIGDYGHGQVICFSPHPEKTTGLEAMVLKGIHRVAKPEPQEVTQEAKELRK